MPGKRIARTAVGTATATTFHQAMPNHATSTAPSPAAATAVIAHFADQIACQAPVATSGRPQFANTRMATIAKKNTAFCHSGRLTSGSGMSAHAAALACSSFLKIRCIEQPDHHAEDDRSDRAGDAHLEAEDPGGERDGQHVDGGAGVQEGSCRADARSHAVDAGEQRQHGARAYGENGAGNRCDPVGQHRVRLRAQVLHHRGLAHEHPDPARDEECRHEAQQHVLPRVPLHQLEGFAQRVVEPRDAEGKPVRGGEQGEDAEERLPFLLQFHDGSP